MHQLMPSQQQGGLGLHRAEGAGGVHPYTWSIGSPITYAPQLPGTGTSYQSWPGLACRAVRAHACMSLACTQKQKQADHSSHAGMRDGTFCTFLLALLLRK
jgi:hypothetical protein